MGLFLRFGHPTPRDVADNGLSAFVDMNELDCDFLLALAPVPIQITQSAPGCSFTDRTMPRSVDPFKIIVAGIPLYCARRYRWASRGLDASITSTDEFS